MKREGESTFQCPLCGNIFEKDLGICPGGCPLGKACSLVCCPRCHYQFVEESKTVNLFKRILKRKRKSGNG